MESEEQSAEAFSLASTQATLTAACEVAGLSADGATLLRFGSNAIYRLRNDPLVVRIGRGKAVLPIAERELAVAGWLANQRYPAVRSQDVTAQPLVVDGRPVTFWAPVKESDNRPSFTDLAGLLRRLHALPEPSFDLPAFSPFGKMRDRIASADDVDNDHLEFLAQRCDELEEGFAKLEFELWPGAIHGDAHRGNVLCQDGVAVLLDFEEFAIGPREWDLIPTALSVRRFGLPHDEYRNFAEAYDFDVLSWPGSGLLLDLREMTMTTWLMQNVDEGAELADEFRLRVHSMKSGDTEREWKPF